MLNLAYYHRQGDGGDAVVRPAVLRQAGLRSLSVTDVDVDRISGGEAMELEATVPLQTLPTAVLRYNGKIILVAQFATEDFDEKTFADMVDYALTNFAPEEIRTHPEWP